MISHQNIHIPSCTCGLWARSHRTGYGGWTHHFWEASTHESSQACSHHSPRRSASGLRGAATSGGWHLATRHLATHLSLRQRANLDAFLQSLEQRARRASALREGLRDTQKPGQRLSCNSPKGHCNMLKHTLKAGKRGIPEADSSRELGSPFACFSFAAVRRITTESRSFRRFNAACT